LTAWQRTIDKNCLSQASQIYSLYIVTGSFSAGMACGSRRRLDEAQTNALLRPFHSMISPAPPCNVIYPESVIGFWPVEGRELL